MEYSKSPAQQIAHLIRRLRMVSHSIFSLDLSVECGSRDPTRLRTLAGKDCVKTAIATKTQATPLSLSIRE